ncbi:MAG: YbjN domain-containing protein [Planctomycetota bacterium]
MIGREATATLEVLRSKVREYLLESFGVVDVDPEGDFSLPHGSTRVFVSVNEWAEGRHIVRVFAITNRDVQITPELTMFLSTANNELLFGKFSLLEARKIVLFEHALLADFLEAEELKVTVAAIAVGADEYDDRIQEIAGGKRFVD